MNKENKRTNKQTKEKADKQTKTKNILIALTEFNICSYMSTKVREETHPLRNSIVCTPECLRIILIYFRSAVSPFWSTWEACRKIFYCSSKRIRWHAAHILYPKP